MRGIALGRLFKGIIDETIFEKSSSLLENFRRIADRDSLRNVESIRNSPKWRALMELSDGIRELIKARWTDEELQAIYGLAQPAGLTI